MAFLKVYTVYDSAAKFFHPPMFLRSRGEALRMWQDLVNDEKTSMCRHPKDFSLIEIGTYDDQKGEFLNEKHQDLGLANMFKNPSTDPTPLFNHVSKGNVQ